MATINDLQHLEDDTYLPRQLLPYEVEVLQRQGLNGVYLPLICDTLKVLCRKSETKHDVLRDLSGVQEIIDIEAFYLVTSECRTQVDFAQGKFLKGEK